MARVEREAHCRKQEASMTRINAANVLATLRIATFAPAAGNGAVTLPGKAPLMRKRMNGAPAEARVVSRDQLPAMRQPEDTAALLRAWLSC